MTALVVVAGAAGTGKTTLGRCLAARIRAALLDLDTLTVPLAGALLQRATGDPAGHGTPFGREVVRPLRYAALTAVALEVLACGTPVVAAAPWTRELADPAWHDALRAEVGERGGRLLVAWLRCDPAVRRERLTARGLARDAAALAEPKPSPAAPLVPHLPFDTGAGVDRACRALAAVAR